MGQFFDELKRRKVVRAALAYLAGCWVIIQLVETLFPIFGLADALIKIVVIVLGIGFPLVLILSWHYQLSVTGLQLQRDVDGSRSTVQAALIGLSVTVFAVFAVLALIVRESDHVTKMSPEAGAGLAAPESSRRSIAVLPFHNVNQKPGNEPFTIGIHDDLLSQVSKIKAIRTISRTSVMQYRDTLKTIPQIARELGVEMILSGGVQRSAEGVRINVQLIKAGTDEHLWSQTYDKELTAGNIFSIQSEIALSVGQALQATLSPDEKARIGAAPTKNLEAYDSYVLGRQRLAKLTDEALQEAVAYFQRAIELDPGFALAYVGLANAYTAQIDYAGMQMSKLLPGIESAVKQALTLDGSLAEAQNAHADLFVFQKDYIAAETAYKAALQLNPNYAPTYFGYGILQRMQGRLEQALTLWRQGVLLDPLSIQLNTEIAGVLGELAQFDEALVQVERIIRLAPSSPLGYLYKADHYWLVAGQLDEAVTWFLKAHALDPDNLVINNTNVYVFGALNDERRARCWADRLQSLDPNSYLTNEALLSIALRFGSAAEAVNFARQALKRKIWGMTLATLRDEDVRVGRYAAARDRYARNYPELLAQPTPEIGYENYQAAIELAVLLEQTGEQERKQWLLAESLKYILRRPRLGPGGFGISDVEIYAQQGQKQKALKAFRQAIDAGWRADLPDYKKNSMTLQSLRNEPEFHVLMEEVTTDLAGQLARVRAKEQPGDVCAFP